MESEQVPEEALSLVKQFKDFFGITRFNEEVKKTAEILKKEREQREDDKKKGIKREKKPHPVDDDWPGQRTFFQSFMKFVYDRSETFRKSFDAERRGDFKEAKKYRNIFVKRILVTGYIIQLALIFLAIFSPEVLLSIHAPGVHRFYSATRANIRNYIFPPLHPRTFITRNNDQDQRNDMQRERARVNDILQPNLPHDVRNVVADFIIGNDSTLSHRPTVQSSKYHHRKANAGLINVNKKRKR